MHQSKAFWKSAFKLGVAATTGATFALAAPLGKPMEALGLPETKKGKEEKPIKPEMTNYFKGPELEMPPSTKWDSNWDFRDPLFLAMEDPSYATASDAEKQSKILEKKPTATRNIFLIRHGQYVTEAKKEEKKLTPLGREQAGFLGKRLHAAKEKFKFDRCVFSTMVRANETGQLMLKEMLGLDDADCVRDSIIVEGPPCHPEPPVAHWRPHSQFHKHSARIEAAFRKYFSRAYPWQKEDSHELVVCHANVIRYFVCRALQLPPEAWLRISLAHSSITWIQIFPSGRVVLKSLGDFGHLPPEKVSFT